MKRRGNTLVYAALAVAVTGSALSAWALPRGGMKQMKMGMVLTTTEPEAAFNAFRLANHSLGAGDAVSVFLLGKGVELDRISDPKFDVQGQARTFLGKGGKILACGTCLKIRNSGGSELCPVSSMKDLYELVRDSDRVLTF